VHDGPLLYSGTHGPVEALAGAGAARAATTTTSEAVTSALREAGLRRRALDIEAPNPWQP
jgi:hypothetical protein